MKSIGENGIKKGSIVNLLALAIVCDHFPAPNAVFFLKEPQKFMRQLKKKKPIIL
jgi:hypothetical protein